MGKGKRKTLKKGGQMGNYNPDQSQSQGMMGYPQQQQQRSWSSSSLNPVNWFSSPQQGYETGSSSWSLGGKKKRGGFRANTQGSLASSAASVSGMSSPKASYVGGKRTRRRRSKKTRRH